MDEVCTLSLALTLVLAAPAGAQPSTVEPIGGETSFALLDTVEKVKALCEGTRPTARVEFKGDGVARGVARAVHEKRRAELVNTPFRVVLPSGAFSFADYDPDERELPLDTRSAWRALDGAVSIFPGGAEDLALDGVDPERAQAWAAAKKAGRAQLAVTFLPADGDNGPCVQNATGKVFTLAVEPLTLELLVDQKVVSRLETEAYDDWAAAQPPPDKGTPVVEVGTTSVEGAATPTVQQVRQVVLGAQKQVLDCYQKGLAQKAALDGTAVLTFGLGRDGRAVEVEVVADSLLAPAVTDCAQRVVRGLTFPAARDPVRVSVALVFSRKSSK